MKDKHPSLTVQRIAAIAVSLALLLVVENYLSLRLSETLQLQFTFLPYSVLGSIAGPIWSAVAAVVLDPVAVLLSGQTFMFGFVVIEGISAFLYGYFFYGKSLKTDRKRDWLYVTLVVLLILGITSFVLTPLVLHHYFKMPLISLYPPRIIKAFIEIPLRVLGTMLVLPRLQEIPVFAKLMGLKK